MKKYSGILLLVLLAAISTALVIYKNGFRLGGAASSSLNLPPLPIIPTKNKNAKFTGRAEIVLSATIAAGNNLKLNKVFIPTNAFVIVKQGGETVGVSPLLTEPETDNLKIGVKLEKGETYTVELRGDNGNGVFDPSSDPSITQNGKTVIKQFKVK